MRTEPQFVAIGQPTETGGKLPLFLTRIKQISLALTGSRCSFPRPNLARPSHYDMRGCRKFDHSILSGKSTQTIFGR